MENKNICQRVIEAANARPDKVAVTLIGPECVVDNGAYYWRQLKH